VLGDCGGDDDEEEATLAREVGGGSICRGDICVEARRIGMVCTAEDQSLALLGAGYALVVAEPRRSQGCDARRLSDMPPVDVRRTTTALPRLSDVSVVLVKCSNTS